MKFIDQLLSNKGYYKLSPAEIYGVKFSKAYLDTENFIMTDYDEKWSKYTMISHDINEIFCINNLKLSVDDYPFGWIQNIIINKSKHEATIGHFAIATQETRKGLGKKMAIALANKLHNMYDINKIIFDELKQKKPEYPIFFEKTLNAEKIKSKDGGFSWVWRFNTKTS